MVLHAVQACGRAAGRGVNAVADQIARAKTYLETTIVSYLTGRPSRDLLVAAHQQLTADWWATMRPAFDCYVSQVVVEEAAAGDAEAAGRRLALIHDLPRLSVTDAATELAEALLSPRALPREAAGDALHIALAAVHGMDYLLTWNCKHIANAAMRRYIEEICAELGYEAPVICTPEELQKE